MQEVKDENTYHGYSEIAGFVPENYLVKIIPEWGYLTPVSGFIQLVDMYYEENLPPSILPPPPPPPPPHNSIKPH